MTDLLTEEVRAFLGREVTYTAPEPFSGAEFRYFALAIGDANPRWQSGEAPPTFVCETSQYLDDREMLFKGGHQWEIPVQNVRAIRGGHEYEFFRPVRAGDRLSVTWRIVDLVQKESSGGAVMLIVTSEASYADQSGELLARNRETTIYQELR